MGYRLAVAALVLMFAWSCKQDSGCPEVTNRNYELSLSDKAIFPFKPGDSMVLANGARVVKFTVGALVSGSLNKIVKRSVPAGCTEPVNTYETSAAEFLSSDTAFKKIAFSLVRAEQPTYNSTGVWTVTAGYQLTFTRPYLELVSDTLYHDTVFVNGTNYKCVKIQADTGSISNLLYYNHNFGILRMNLPQGQVWNRK